VAYDVLRIYVTTATKLPNLYSQLFRWNSYPDSYKHYHNIYLSVQRETCQIYSF